MRRYQPNTLQRTLRQARVGQRRTQGEVAERIGTSQSALSMWERGQVTALAAEKVERLALELGVALDDLPRPEDAAPETATHPVLKTCRHPDCPTNIPYVVVGELHFVPRPVRAARGQRTFCRYCLEPHTDACDCGLPIEPAAYCGCGRPYVDRELFQPSEEALTDLEGWVARERDARRWMLENARISKELP